MTKPSARSRDGSTARRGAHAARAVALIALLAGYLALLNPAPAQAHLAGTSGSPTNYRAEVTGIRPAAPNLEVTVGLGGQWVRIANQGAAEIVALGYRNEPFLRLSGNRVQVNELSSTAAEAGQTTRGPDPAVEAPDRPATDPAAEPKWVTQSEGYRATWADERIDGPRPAEGSVSWELPLIVDGQQVTVLGSKERAPSPVTWAWLAGLVVLTGAVAALGWMRDWYRPMAAVVAVGVAAFVLHLIGTGFAPQQSGPLFTWIGIAAVGAFALLIGLVTVLSVLRRRRTAPDRVITTGLMVLLLAATDLSVLWNAELPFGGPEVLDRGLTMITYAVAFGVLAGGVHLARQARAVASGPGAEPASGAVPPGTATG